MSPTLRAAFQGAIEAAPARSYDFLFGLQQPSMDAQPANIDLRLQRNRTSLAFSLFPGEGNFDVGVTYLHERRTGTRAANGTAFGFYNVVETPEPLKYITQDFGVNATFRGDWGNVFAGFNFNDFENKYETFGWDNPWRATDSTDGRAYLGPVSTTNGPATGLMALTPSNEAWTIKGGTNLKFGRFTRLRADAQIGQWTQNEQAFIGWTTNTAILTPEGVPAVSAPLPANNLDGKIDVLALNGYFTTKLTPGLRLNARYRLYENENKTPRITFNEGYVRFDAVWEEIPRISVPNGFSSNLFDAYVTYDLGRILGLEAGWKYNKIRRDFRESEHTTENMFRLAADARFGIGVVRAIYEFGDRSYDEYLPVEAEEHSFLEAGQPANSTVLRRYDQNERDRNRFGVQAQVSPGSGIVTLSASYFYNKDEYANGLVSCNADYHDGDVGDSATTCAGGQTETLGLEEAEYTTFNLDADFTPTENFSVNAFYTREDMMSLQDGIQSGGSLTFSDAARWASSIDTTVDSFGAGARWDIVPDTWLLSLFYRYQKADGSNDFTGGSDFSDIENISAYDDTTLNFFSANLKWNCSESWAVSGGAFWEKYEFDDSQTGNLLNYMPGSFFLVANRGGYDSWAGWLNLIYSFQ
jgi:hypothetical protein